MTSLKVYTGARDAMPFSVHNVAELRRLFADLQKQRSGKHFLVRLVNETGDELMIGLGPRAEIATFTPVVGNVVYNALGDLAFAGNQETIGFDWVGHWFDMGPENLLPVPCAQRIAEHWLVSGARDETLRWEECRQRGKR